jgi:hypothetical protein
MSDHQYTGTPRWELSGKWQSFNLTSDVEAINATPGAAPVV